MVYKIRNEGDGKGCMGGGVVDGERRVMRKEEGREERDLIWRG